MSLALELFFKKVHKACPLNKTTGKALQGLKKPEKQNHGVVSYFKI